MTAGSARSPHIPSASAIEIERVESLNVESFDVRVGRGRPFVLAGGCLDWGAVSKWTPEYLANAVGEVPVRVSNGDRMVFGVDPHADRRVTTMPFLTYLKSLEGNGAECERGFYLQKYPLRHFPKLAEDFRTPACLVNRKLFETALWVSREGSLTPMHFDLTEGMLAQVRGMKRVMLCEPVLSLLKPHAWYSRAPHFTSLPAHDLGLEQLRERYRVYELWLEAGDILYIPSPWWHQVRSRSAFNVSINFWWLPKWRRAFRYWNHSLRSIQMELRRRILFGGGLPGERQAQQALVPTGSSEAQ